MEVQLDDAHAVCNEKGFVEQKSSIPELYTSCPRFAALPVTVLDVKVGLVIVTVLSL